MNANLNMNAYKNQMYRSSDDIRRAYLLNTRRREISTYIAKVLANPTVLKAITIAKVILAVSCAVGLFSVISLIENGELSSISGIVYALVIAATECLCFIPVKSGSDRNDR